MKARWLDIAALLCLIAALAVLLVRGEQRGGVLLVPMLLPNEPLDGLMAPGADVARLQSRGELMGEPITIEDLIRLSWALVRQPEALPPGTAPLSPEERAALLPLVERADAERAALLEVERRLAAAEGRLGAATVELAAELSPAQRAVIQAERDQVSVEGTEAVYYDALKQGLK